MVPLSIQLVNIRMINYAEKCSVSYNKEKKKFEHETKSHIENKDETESQINTMPQAAAI
jgi:hypothetical protein